MKNLLYIIVALLLVGMYSCKPSVPDKTDLGPLPNPTFSVSQGDTPNEFILSNTTSGAFMTHWNIENNGSKEGEVVTVTIPFMGDYDVTMTTFSSGGSASTTQTVTVTEDDPDACSGNLEIISGCGAKTWVLAYEAGALNVGPTIDESWWGNSEADLGARACHFNDTYTFTSTQVFEFNNQGDFWADTDGGGNLFPADLGVPVGCNPSEDLAASPYAVWDSGIHAFNITENTLTVIGEGAWIGLYKIGTTAEVGTPQQEVTFNISSLTEDRMVLFTDYGGLVWRITLTAQ